MTELNLPKKAELEKAIVTVGYGGLYVFLAYQGDQIECDLEEISPSPNDVIGDDAFPEKIGIYYWEGRPEWHGGYFTWAGDVEPELKWTEEVIRKATKQDLEEFGLGHLVEQLQ